MGQSSVKGPEQTGPTYEFGPFRMNVEERKLLRDGQLVPLTPKAFELLMMLVESRGHVVDKDELINRVWADSFVEEGNLKVTVSMLRKALEEGGAAGERYIETIPRKGYRFAADVKEFLDNGHELVVRETTRASVTIQEETKELMSSSMASFSSLLSHRRTAIAGLLVLFVGVIGAIWLYESLNRRRQATGSLPPPQLNLRRFTTHGGAPYRVAISPDGKTLVYWQRINDKFSLWLGEIETNTSVLLNQQEDLIFDNLVFTPDGSNIYFNLSGGKRPQAMLARMSVLGGAITELIPLGSPITFAPDGKQMAFIQSDTDANQSSLIIADADGKNQRKLFSRMRAESFLSEAASWSPDGKSIAFSAFNASRQGEIAAVSVADGSFRRIGSQDWPEVLNLSWLPDGSGVIVVSRENVGERRRQIWLVSYPNGEARRINNDLNIFLRSSIGISADGKLAVLQGHVNSEIWIAPYGDARQARRVLEGVAPRYEGIDGLAWTPEGRLLYTAYIGDSLVIWSITSDGGDLRQLTPSKPNASDSNLCVTSDGRYVVFQSNRSGAFEIWRINSDGSNLKQLTTGGNNLRPSLSPDGQWIVFNSARDGKATLTRIPIDDGESTWIANISSSWAQVSPDGRYIACVVSSSRPLLVIPFAGGEVVKSFPLAEAALRTVRMHWTPDGKAIIYRGDPRGLLWQSLDKEAPRPFKGFEEMLVHNLAWSVDGKNLAYCGGTTSQEIILIENFK